MNFYKTKLATLSMCIILILFIIIPIRHTCAETSSDPVTYLLVTTIEGKGKITPEPGNNYYERGTVLQLTAIPDDGWVFIEWLGGEVDIDNRIIMDSNKSIVAVFEERFVIIEDEEIPAASADIIEIPELTEEPLPEVPTQLPKTGGVSGEIYYCLGGFLVSLGVLFRKLKINSYK